MSGSFEVFPILADCTNRIISDIHDPKRKCMSEDWATEWHKVLYALRREGYTLINTETGDIVGKDWDKLDAGRQAWNHYLVKSLEKQNSVDLEILKEWPGWCSLDTETSIINLENRKSRYLKYSPKID